MNSSTAAIAVPMARWRPRRRQRHDAREKRDRDSGDGNGRQEGCPAKQPGPARSGHNIPPQLADRRATKKRALRHNSVAVVSPSPQAFRPTEGIAVPCLDDWPIRRLSGAGRLLPTGASVWDRRPRVKHSSGLRRASRFCRRPPCGTEVTALTQRSQLNLAREKAIPSPGHSSPGHPARLLRHPE